MEKDIRILVVDDHPVVREGLQRMLGQEDMEVVGESANGEALSQVEMLCPNIVLTDIKPGGMDGIELTRQLTEHYGCNVIVLTVDDEYLAPAMEAGATGYLLKDIKGEELTRAIRQVHRGEVVISQSIARETRIEYEQRYGKKAEAGMVEEVQLVIPPPIEANQLLRFISRVEEILHSSLLQIVGSWEEGTAITVCLIKPTPLADILNKLAEIPEIEAIVEKPPEETLLSLLKKATAIPRLKVRTRTTIFVNFKGKDETPLTGQPAVSCTSQSPIRVN